MLKFPEISSCFLNNMRSNKFFQQWTQPTSRDTSIQFITGSMVISCTKSINQSFIHLLCLYNSIDKIAALAFT